MSEISGDGTVCCYRQPHNRCHTVPQDCSIRGPTGNTATRPTAHSCYVPSKRLRSFLHPCSTSAHLRPVKAPMPVCPHPALFMDLQREAPCCSPICASYHPKNHSRYGHCRARRRNSKSNLRGPEIRSSELVFLVQQGLKLRRLPTLY